MPAPFDEIQFPWQIGYGIKAGPTRSTDIVVCSSGYEQRNANWINSRRRFNFSTGMKSDKDVGQVAAFFEARAAGARGFRFKDWGDYTALMGTNLGAGIYPATLLLTSTTFQLQKVYNYAGDGTGVTDPQSYTRTINKPCNYGTPSVPINHPDGTAAIPVSMYVSGVLQSSSLYTVDYTTGIVTFGVAPSATPTANFEFDVPSRFDTDNMDPTNEDFNTSIWHDCQVIELRI